MFFNKTKKLKKKASKVLSIWCPTVCGSLGENLDTPKQRKLTIFYLIGSSDYVCQSSKLGDEDFAEVTREVLIQSGFNKHEIWEQLGIFARQSLSEEAFEYLMKGAEHYKKWMMEGNQFAPMLLSMELIGDE
jgi:hypothetical protein